MHQQFFSREVVTPFKDFIQKFLEVDLDDWMMFNLLKYHVDKLRLMLDKCMQLQIPLNIKKCMFFSPFGVLLGHVICKHGLLANLAMISIIVNLEVPTVVRKLCVTLRNINYYQTFLKGYAHTAMLMD